MHTSVDLVSRHTISYKLHSYTKRLYVLIPALIIEEEHLLVFDPTVSVYPLKVRRLATGIYLHVIEVVDCARGRPVGTGYLKELEHFAAEIGSTRARGCADQDVLVFKL